MFIQSYIKLLEIFRTIWVELYYGNTPLLNLTDDFLECLLQSACTLIPKCHPHEVSSATVADFCGGKMQALLYQGITGVLMCF